MRPLTTTLERTLQIAATLAMLTATAARAELLDGTKWKVQVVPSEAAAAKGEKEFADELVFADGKFSSTATLAKGYPQAAYRAEDESYEIEFESVLVNTAEGKATWSGGIDKTSITGRLEYIHKDGTKLYYTFKGKRE